MLLLTCFAAAMFIATLIELDHDTYGRRRPTVVMLTLFVLGCFYLAANDPKITPVMAGYLLAMLTMARTVMLIRAIWDRLATWRDV